MPFRISTLLVILFYVFSTETAAQIHPEFVPSNEPYLPALIEAGKEIPDSVTFFQLATNLVDTNLRIVQIAEYDHQPGDTSTLTVTRNIEVVSDNLNLKDTRTEYQLFDDKVSRVKRYRFIQSAQEYQLEADSIYLFVQNQYRTKYETYAVANNPASSGYFADRFDRSGTVLVHYRNDYNDFTRQIVFPGIFRKTYAEDALGELRFIGIGANRGLDMWEDTIKTIIDYDVLPDGRMFYYNTVLEEGSPAERINRNQYAISYGQASDTLERIQTRYLTSGNQFDSILIINEYDLLGRRTKTTRHRGLSTSDEIFTVVDFTYLQGRQDTSYSTQTLTTYTSNAPGFIEGIQWHYSSPPPPALLIVGPTGGYITPQSLSSAGVLVAGDTVLFEPATYRGVDALAVWSVDDLTFIAPNGGVHLYAEGENILGKGIWVASGDNISIDGFNFHDAAVPDQNGAGIRLDGSGLNVRNCGFYNNENGILTSNTNLGHVDIESCVFGQNGAGDGFSHNLYIGTIDSLSFIGNYSYGANVGHQLKSRARVNDISANRFSDEQSGNSSRLIDLPNGGQATLTGNVMHQGPNAENSNLIGYGLEGLTNTGPHEFVSIHNTLVNERNQGGLFFHLASGTTAAIAINNLMVGDGMLVDGNFTEEAGNLSVARLADAGFRDPMIFDYQLTTTSDAVDAGVLPAATSWVWQQPNVAYAHPAMTQNRIVDGQPDAGATGFIRTTSTSAGPSSAFAKTPILVSNLVADVLRFRKQPSATVRIISFAGQPLNFSSGNNQTLDVSHLPSGIYILEVEGLGREVFVKR